MELVGWWWRRWLRSNSWERAVLAVGVLSAVFTGLFTWDMVVYRGMAVEATEEWARLFAEWGGKGVASVVAFKLSALLVFWGLSPPLSVVLCVPFSLDFLHNLLMWALGSGVPSPLCSGPDVALGFLLAALLVRAGAVRA